MENNALPQDIEFHPLEPFLPANAKLLFLGSFPPPRKRWCMDFYYPNFGNDHWRIEGQVWFGDRNHFVDIQNKCFRKEEIVEFMHEKGIAMYDTARAVRRLKGNASDAFLEIVEPTDIRALLRQIPLCKAIATTGEKATGELCRYFGVEKLPAVGGSTELGDGLQLYRLPSSSRAYPLAFEKKCEAYRRVFKEVFGLLKAESKNTTIHKNTQ
jgi:G:T/U-mismatch repair DNA glycosylase